MDDKTFNQIIETKLEETHKVLLDKNAGYANEDRLHAFTTATALGPEGETRSQALAGMMKKHTVSVYDMINSGEAYSEEMWDEKIGDHINYLLLLRATIVEDKLVKESDETVLDALRAKLSGRWPHANPEERDVYFSDNAEKGSTFSARREEFVRTGDYRCLTATFFG